MSGAADTSGAPGTGRTPAPNRAHPADGRRYATVERAVREMFEDAGVRGWLQVSALHGTAPGITVDPEEAVPIGSVYKVPLMVAFCRLVDSGRLDPREPLTLDPAHRLPGPTGVSVLRDPVTMSLRDLVASMMTVSDNAAADTVLRRVGPEFVEDVCRDLGLARTRIAGGAAGTFDRLLHETGTDSLSAAMERLADNDLTTPHAVYDPVNKSSSTPSDMVRLLRALWTDTAASPAQCGFMRGLMALQPWTHRLAAGFPHDEVRVYGKTGTFGSMRHEAGVVELPDGGTYLAAVFTQAARADRRLPRADAVIGAAARVAVEELRGREGT